MYYLGIDWGQSKCGMAIADSENMIASLYKQVSEKQVYREIFDLFEKEGIEKIVVGFYDGLEKDKKFNNFLDRIKEKKIPIEFENEEFSTQLAHKNLIDAQRKKIFQKDDIESARIILQSWLDKKKKKC